MKNEFLPGVIDAGATSHQQKELRDAITEAAKRKIEALRLYEPSPFQERFHECGAKEVGLIAGNQVGKAIKFGTLVLTPEGWVKAEDVSVGDVLIGGDGKPTTVTGVYPQGVKPLYRVTFDDGVSVDCCKEHLWKCRIGKKERFKGDRSWCVHSTEELLKVYPTSKPIEQADIPLVEPVDGFTEPTVDPYTLGYLLGDGSLAHSAVQFTTGDPELTQWIHHAGCEMKKVSGKFKYSINAGGRRNPLKAELTKLGLMGKRSSEKFVPDSCHLWCATDRLRLLQGLMDSDGHVTKHGVMEFYSVSTGLTDGVVALVQSLGGKCKVKWRVTKCDGKEGQPSSRVRIVLPSLNPFRLSRKAERYRDISRNRTRIIKSIEPVGKDEAVCFTVDNADHTFVIENYVVTHNSLAAFVELARAIAGCDPYDKYPKKDGIAVVLGLDEAHIGRVIHSYLFRSGRFRIIRDKETQEWRAWHPWEEEDRAEETKPAPPLLPPRLIKKIAWRKRASYVFDSVEFHNGWILYAMSSKGEPAGGFQLDIGMIDEDIERPDWYDELIARTSMRDGRIIWSALPLNKNDALCNLVDRADAEKENEDPKSVVIRATVYDNIYMPPSAREENIRIWKSKGEEEYRKRALGEMVIDSVLMYPTFSKDVHSCVSDDPRNKLQEFLKDTMGMPGKDWCLYAVVDPGFSVCATTFWAVPPPDEFGDFRVLYDMAYQKQCTAEMWGEMMRTKCVGRRFQGFIIDAHGGRIRSIGSGITPQRQYEGELEKHRIECFETGHHFMAGSDDIQGREGKLRQWLNVRADGTPTMYVVTQRCDKVVWEFGRFRRKVVNGVIQEDGNRRGYCHAVETCEYAAAHGLEYHKPPKASVESSAVKQILKAREMREKQRRCSIYTPHSSSDGITLGPRGDS